MGSPASVNVLIHVGPYPAGPSSSGSPTAVSVPTAPTVPGVPVSPPAVIPASPAPAVPAPTPAPAPFPVATVHPPVVRPPAGALPFTGLDALLLLTVAACLIGAGLLFHLLARPTAAGWGSGPTGLIRREAV